MKYIAVALLGYALDGTVIFLLGLLPFPGTC